MGYGITDEAVDRYLRSLLPERLELLRQLEAEAGESSVPIVGPQVGRLFFLLTRALGARRVLELGAGTGYSARWFAEAVGDGGEVVSVERDTRRAAAVRRNLSQAAAKVRVLQQEAFAALQGFAAAEFDLVFIDLLREFEDTDSAPRLLAEAVRVLRPGGMLLADNVLCSKQVTDPGESSPTVEGIRRFNWELMNHPQLWGVLLPLRDGVGIGLKR